MNSMSESVPPDAVATQPPDHVDALPAGTMLGEFELQGLLGVGGFGMVYRGYDHSLQRPVAIKEYMPSALVGRATDLQVSARSSADAKPFQLGLNSFIAEARLLARFDHPSLVKVYRFWEANNTAYMAMPLYEGMTLKQARRLMSGPPPEDWLRAVLWSVMEALKVLHANNTLHRDISPDNIFLQDVGPPVLLDLGAARRAVLDQGQKHTAILKVNYAPIEQYADAKDFQEGPWTDLYAIGAVVHNCLCNEAPLPATLRVLRDRMPSFARVAKTAQTHFPVAYSTSFVEAIEHALVVEPSERTQSVADFCEEMQLQAPEGWADFDWRHTLGDAVSLQDVDVPLGAEPFAEQAAQAAVTQPHIRVERSGSRRSAAKSSIRGPEHAARREARRRARRMAKAQPRTEWGWFLGAAVVALGLGLVLWQRSEKMVAVSPSAALVATVVPVSEISDGVVVPPVAATGAAMPVPVPTQEAPARAVPVRKADKLAGQSVKGVAVPAPPGGRSSAEIHAVPCADSGVLTRSMCLYRECQKPEFAKLALCIEEQTRWDQRAKAGVSF